MLGPLLSAGASIVGGLLGKSSADSARESQERLAQQNIDLQKEFANFGIRWKVNDAKAAGIHPLYALGASTPSFSPVSANFAADTSLPNALASAGQDIGRAINSTRNASERNTAFDQTVRKLSLEKMGLENDLLRSQIARTSGAQGNPPLPTSPHPYLIPGQSGSGLINAKPMDVTNVDPKFPHIAPSAVADVAPARTDAGITINPSKDVKELIEDSPYEWGHYWRNAILPAISQSAQDRQTASFPKPKPGHFWKYIPFRGEYQEVPINEGWYSRASRMWK